MSALTILRASAQSLSSLQGKCPMQHTGSGHEGTSASRHWYWRTSAAVVEGQFIWARVKGSLQATMDTMSTHQGIKRGFASFCLNTQQ